MTVVDLQFSLCLSLIITFDLIYEIITRKFECFNLVSCKYMTKCVYIHVIYMYMSVIEPLFSDTLRHSHIEFSISGFVPLQKVPLKFE